MHPVVDFAVVHGGFVDRKRIVAIEIEVYV